MRLTSIQYLVNQTVPVIKLQYNNHKRENVPMILPYFILSQSGKQNINIGDISFENWDVLKTKLTTLYTYSKNASEVVEYMLNELKKYTFTEDTKILLFKFIDVSDNKKDIIVQLDNNYRVINVSGNLTTE